MPVVLELQGQRSVKVDCVTPNWFANGKFYDASDFHKLIVNSKRHCYFLKESLLLSLFISAGGNSPILSSGSFLTHGFCLSLSFKGDENKKQSRFCFSFAISVTT